MKHINQMTAMASITIPHSMYPIFQYIFDCLGFNPMNGNFNFMFQGLNRLWMVSVTLILNGSPQKIVQRGHIIAPKRPIDIRISADFSIFENGAQKIYRYVCCVASSSLLAVTAVSCSFSKKNGPIMLPYQNPHQTITHRGCIGLKMMTVGFSEPHMRQFCLLTLVLPGIT